MRKVSKGFYLGSYLGSSLLASILFFYGTRLIWNYDIEGWLSTLVLYSAFIPLIYAVIIVCKLLFKAWSLIQDSNVRVTPGKAIGFLLIPFFNLFWIFRAIWGFSKDYNSYIHRHNISTSKLPEKLFLSSCILFVLNFFLRKIPIPLVAIISWLITLVIFLLVLNKICDAVNSISSVPNTEQ